jgi:hypothetical protein
MNLQFTIESVLFDNFRAEALGSLESLNLKVKPSIRPDEIFSAFKIDETFLPLRIVSLLLKSRSRILSSSPAKFPIRAILSAKVKGPVVSFAS